VWEGGESCCRHATPQVQTKKFLTNSARQGRESVLHDTHRGRGGRSMIGKTSSFQVVSQAGAEANRLKREKRGGVGHRNPLLSQREKGGAIRVIEEADGAKGTVKVKDRCGRSRSINTMKSARTRPSRTRMITSHALLPTGGEGKRRGGGIPTKRQYDFCLRSSSSLFRWEKHNALAFEPI